MTAMLWSYCEQHGITNYELVDDGDDCLVILPSDQLHKLDNVPGWFRTLGFRMKVEEPVYEVEHIQFCQSHPVYDGQQYRMIRDFPSACRKDAISIKPLNGEDVYLGHLQAIGDCGMSLCSGIPVYQSIYKSWRTGHDPLIDPSLESGMYYLSLGMECKESAVTLESRISFWRAFGVTPDEQEALEQYFSEQNVTYTDPIDANHSMGPEWTKYGIGRGFHH
jgi:hypothetical protein